MKRLFLGLVLVMLSLAPSVSFARGIPLFFQTGDELFEIQNAPKFEDGFSVGYACQRFGVFGADIWTWDCDLMAINLEQFSAGPLEEPLKAELAKKYTLSDRVRNAWNHYGAIMVLLGFAIVGLLGLRKG